MGEKFFKKKVRRCRGLLKIPSTQAHPYALALEILDQLDQTRLWLLQ